MPRLIFNAKTLKLCSKIKFATQPNKPPVTTMARCDPFDVFDHPGRRERGSPRPYRARMSVQSLTVGELSHLVLRLHELSSFFL